MCSGWGAPSDRPSFLEELDCCEAVAQKKMVMCTGFGHLCPTKGVGQQRTLPPLLFPHLTFINVIADGTVILAWDIWLVIYFTLRTMELGKKDLQKGFQYLNSTSTQCLKYSVSFRSLIRLTSGKPNNIFCCVVFYF